MPRPRILILVLAASLVLAACRVDATVGVTMRGDGSGRVSVRLHLDPAAVRAVEVDGRRLDQALRLGDLGASGWRVSAWRRDAAGGATISVSHAFATPAEAESLVTGLAGPDAGLVTGRIEHREGALRDRSRVVLTIDPARLRVGIERDATLAARLRAAGVDPARVAAAIDGEAADSVRLGLRASLPGADPVRGRPDGGRVVLDRAATEWHASRLVLVALGVGLLVAAALVFGVGRVAVRRRHGRHAARRGHHPHGRHAPQDPGAHVGRRPRGEHGRHAPR
jgi:hypothetical protein